MNNLKILLAILIILSVTSISYFPTIENDFVNWDDDGYVIKNELIKEFTFKNIKKIFTTSFVSMYTPIAVLSYAVEYKIFNLNPHAYHTTNLIFHLLNSIVVFWLFLILSRNNKISFFVSIFFAIHPMHVESVAWIAERKDVLYALFYLGSMIAYLRYLKNFDQKKYLILSIILFIISLFTKPMAVSLPFVLFLLDYYYERKIEKRAIIEKIPFFVLAIFFSILAVYTESDAIERELLYSFPEITVFFFYRSCFYFFKLFMPLNLSAIHPYPNKIDGLLPFKFILSPFIFTLIVILLIYLSIRFKKHRKTIIFGVLFFYITIAPVLQFIPVGQAIVAERYTYIPYLGLFFIVATFVQHFYDDYVKNRAIFKALFLLLFFIIVASTGYMTWQRCHIWRDGIIFWSDFIKNNPNSPAGYNSRGNAHFLIGDYRKAFNDYRNALKIDPNHIGASYNICILYKISGDYNNAITWCKRTIELKNDYAEAYGNLGDIFFFIGKKNDAKLMYREAIKRNEKFIPAYINIGVIYYYEKEYDISFRYLNKAIELGGRIHPDLFEFVKNYSSDK